jgi:hypothetical protein
VTRFLFSGNGREVRVRAKQGPEKQSTKGHDMKKRFITQGILGGVLSLGVLFIQSTFGQNTLQFTGISTTPEKAIHLAWASNTNEVYEIDETDSLIDTNTGKTPWNKLYDDYPSQGTNTFWLDTGDYNSVPGIPHPKYEPMRFYRIVMTGTNTGPNPTITILSPTNGATVSSNLTVTVSASSDQLLVQTILYVDGQEMPPSDDGTNFVINTCEWWNGQHTLFAVAKSQSALEGNPHDPQPTYGRTASSYVNVAFSQPFFEPSLGETQQVTANFAANSDWTLQIQDVNSNTVRTATGSGSSMEFDWDGTGDGGTNIPDGVYNYVISAQTNGESGDAMLSGGSSSSLARSSAARAESSELWAVATDSENVVPLAIYPHGFDTNGLIIFSATPSEVESLTASSSTDETSVMDSDSGSSFNADDASSPSAPSGQTTTAPVRPPPKPVKGVVGTIGIAYEQYLSQGFATTHDPPTGWPYPVQPQYVAIDGTNATSGQYFDYIITAKTIGDNFSAAMANGGWKTVFNEGNNSVTYTDLKKTSLGGNSIFNNVNFGVLLGHGSYSTTAEDDNIKYSYFWLWNSHNDAIPNTAVPMRFADFDFGGSDPTNGLRWMTIIACNLLNQSDFNSMRSHSRLPINGNLHLLNGVAGAFPGFNPAIGTYYATNLLNNNTTIQQAWANAGITAYSGFNLGNVGQIIFVTEGWPDCLNDKLLLYSSPDSGDTIQYQPTVVYPTPQ